MPTTSRGMRIEEGYCRIRVSTGEIRGISFAKDGYGFAGSKLSKQKLTYGKLVTKFGALPVEGVAVLSIPNKGFREGRPILDTFSQNQRFISNEGTGKLTAPYQDSIKEVYVLQTPSRNLLVTCKGGPKTENPLEGVLPNSTSSEPSEISLIPLSVIIDLLTGPAVIQSTGGGGTTNDLDWNDERRRRQEAQENQYVNRPFKRRR